MGRASITYSNKEYESIHRELLAMIKSPWKIFLSVNVQESEMALFRKHERTGRPIGDDAFIERLEWLLDRPLKSKKSGPKVIDK